jgi:uncharacterized protein (AIM24 family)
MTLGGAVDDERKLTEHLAHASEFLRADRLTDAEREIASALTIRQTDLRARNLRGLFLFRASRYEEARAVYIELSQAHPNDAALRLNLGLVELRMGRHAEAAVNLRRVIVAEPDNLRAQGYLGLALMRSGDLGAARDAFNKAGQHDLARQVEERMAQSDDAVAARLELRHAANAGWRALESEQPFAAIELEAPSDEAKRGAWQLRLPGERPPLPAPEGAAADFALPLAIESARPVAAFATARLLRPTVNDDPFALCEGGMLVVRVEGKLPTRTLGAVASTGTLEFEPMQRRVRGQATDEPFGEGAEAMFRAVGKGVMVVAPRGAQFSLLSLAEDIVYVREPSLFAFEETLTWENGRVPGGAPDDAMRVVQFRGNGRVVMRIARPVYTLKIEPESPLFVEQTTLAGWIGRVVPRVMHGPNGEPTPYIECSGEGVVIIEEPAPL